MQKKSDFGSMFTGIIEALGEVKDLIKTGTNYSFWIETSFTSELKIDQSIAHNGVCLTIEDIQDNRYKVTAIQETLNKTNLKDWKKGTIVNLERSLLPTSRLDGHFVQGHVDATAICTQLNNVTGSYEIQFSFDKEFASYIVEKGSIAINGISLTVFDVTEDTFKVAIIPYTWQHTMLHLLQIHDCVNIEFDLIGKYILRKLSLTLP
ncbi:MAG: riboflavin synthase [Chitinophagaceae bacterium]